MPLVVPGPSAGVNAGRLDVLHNTDNVYVLAVANRVGFSFNGAVKVMVKEQLVARYVLKQVDNVLFKLLLIDHDLHALATQYIRRAHQQREVKLIVKL